MNRSFIFLLIFLLLSYSFTLGQTANDSFPGNKHHAYIKFDTSKIAILPYDNAEYSHLERCKETDLTYEDLKDIEYLILKFRDDYNAEQIKQYNDLVKKQKKPHIPLFLDIQKFRRQYIAVVNCKGETEVWINCFCNSSNIDWHKEVVKSETERMCSFKLTINLTKSKSYNFRLNPFKNGI